MKVKELIEKLKLEDENAEVILSADEEGNYYSPLEGEIYENNKDIAQKCIVLFPIN